MLTPNTPTPAAPATATSTTSKTGETGLLALVIEHQHGTDITVHRTHEGALAQVDQFVAEWWDTEMGEDHPKPNDATEARETYFETVGDEHYLITDTALFD